MQLHAKHNCPNLFCSDRLFPVATRCLHHICEPSPWGPSEWPFSFLRVPLGARRLPVVSMVSDVSRPTDFTFSLDYNDVLHTTHPMESLIVSLVKDTPSNLLVTANVFSSGFVGIEEADAVSWA